MCAFCNYQGLHKSSCLSIRDNSYTLLHATHLHVLTQTLNKTNGADDFEHHPITLLLSNTYYLNKVSQNHSRSGATLKTFLLNLFPRVTQITHRLTFGCKRQKSSVKDVLAWKWCVKQTLCTYFASSLIGIREVYSFILIRNRKFICLSVCLLIQVTLALLTH